MNRVPCTCGSKSPEECWEKDREDGHFTETLPKDSDVGVFLTACLLVVLLAMGVMLLLIELGMVK